MVPEFVIGDFGELRQMPEQAGCPSRASTGSERLLQSGLPQNALAVWRLGIPIGTGKLRFVIGLYQIFMTALSLPDHRAAGGA
jgi:hypothetical protein